MESLANAPITLCLLILNIALSLYAFANRDFFEKNLFWMRAVRESGEIHRFISSGFLHVNQLHLFINMYVLFGFGPVLEQTLGSAQFAFLYMASLIAGNVWEYFNKAKQPDYRAAGASGAISGVILSFCLFYPFATLLLFFVLPMWAIFLAALFIWVSLVLSRQENTLIGHGAHLGGALAGLFITLAMRPEVFGQLMAQISDKFG